MAKQEHRISAGHLWNPSYYVGTPGDVTEDVIGKYIEFGELLVLKLRENGNHAELIGESWSTKTCCICDSRNTIVNDRDFYCKDCNASIDRDDNGQANILKKGLKKKRVYEAVWPVLLQQLKAVTRLARPRRGPP